jgi:hypothetical protein|tara:strand:+ start:79 stop:531 length:453 start_codon:yes stop_codon:yes gene_type:complete
MKNTVIFDLDGTLALTDIRREMAMKINGKIDFDIFHDSNNIQFDKPNEPVIRMAELFADDGFQIVIFTGRPDTTEAATRQWLSKTGVPYHKLVMRDDERYFKPDEILKKQMLDDHLDINDVFCVVDDRQKVVDMWREIGLMCFQVAPGDF